MCKDFEEDRESDIAAADIQIFEFLQSGHRLSKEQEGLYVRYGDFQAFFAQASIDRANLAAEDAAQAERIKEMEAVCDAAKAWWVNLRPLSWSEAEHFAHPTVNAKEHAALAFAIAALKEAHND